MTEPRCVVDERFIVGESPRWHEDEQALYWVDIYRPSVERLEPATGARRSPGRCRNASAASRSAGTAG